MVRTARFLAVTGGLVLVANAVFAGTALLNVTTEPLVSPDAFALAYVWVVGITIAVHVVLEVAYLAFEFGAEWRENRTLTESTAQDTFRTYAILQYAALAVGLLTLRANFTFVNNVPVGIGPEYVGFVGVWGLTVLLVVSTVGLAWSYAPFGVAASSKFHKPGKRGSPP